MKFAILLILYLLPAWAYSGNGYLCVPDLVTGFSFQKGEGWGTAKFKAEEKYVVVRPSDRDKKMMKEKRVAWVVRKLGNDIPTATCEQEANEFGLLYCEGFEEFRINLKSLRFLSAYLLGYYNDDKDSGSMFAEGRNTPSIAIGKCSPL